MQTTPTAIEAILPHQPPTARLVLNSLHHAQSPATLVALCISTGSTPGTLEKVVRKLMKDGYLIRTEHGSAPIFSINAAVIEEAR